MSSMLKPDVHCCCCVTGVFAALLGVILLATGVCVVLNYGIAVDTQVLPPEWQNENGQRIVGIILTCCGFVFLVVSIIVSSLYFTVCARSKTTERGSVNPESRSTPNSQGHGSVSGKAKHSRTSELREGARQGTHSPNSHRKHSKGKRPKVSKAKRPNLATHQEVSEAEGSQLTLMGNSRHKNSIGGADNQGFELHRINTRTSTVTTRNVELSGMTTPTMSNSSASSLPDVADSNNSADVLPGAPLSSDRRLPPLISVTSSSGNLKRRDTAESITEENFGSSGDLCDRTAQRDLGPDDT